MKVETQLKEWRRQRDVLLRLVEAFDPPAPMQLFDDGRNVTEEARTRVLRRIAELEELLKLNEG